SIASSGWFDIAASTAAQHATEWAMGPTESSASERGKTPSTGTRCAVGLNPTRPQKAAGIRTDPMVSVPSAATAIPSATDTAAPEEEPPGTRPFSRSQGFLQFPK